MRYFFAATPFSTILPLGKTGTYELQKMIQYFPSAGLLMGILLVSFDHLPLWLWRQPVASLLDVMFLALLTGAFHLDVMSDFREKLKLSAFWGMIIPVVLSGLLGWPAIGLNVGFVAIAGAFPGTTIDVWGGIAGDMLGAMTANYGVRTVSADVDWRRCSIIRLS